MRQLSVIVMISRPSAFAGLTPGRLFARLFEEDHKQAHRKFMTTATRLKPGFKNYPNISLKQ
jgi:hypothetical protein